ncbi:class I SAM-dependent methyltransferase [Ruminococcus sp. AM31-15AC]|uniref:class I SAM-dependent methyltransferase n=1 Tax=Ruminococcus sp. AM31-15AC TaxID=2293202 RepID=UPI000E534AFE|nr:class I SAM-dependent methyltransferase [Ruminococcus sp. AM31-15AC]
MERGFTAYRQAYCEGRYVTQKDIDERIKDAKRTLKYKTPDDDYDRAMIEQAKKVLEEYGVSPDEEPRQSPLEKIIAKAEAEGIPVEITDEPAKERAVFMDNRDETYIEVQQTEGGVEYTIYAPDLTPVDGGEWEMEEAMELDEAAAALLQTSTYALTEISDYDRFIEIADRNTELDVPAELAKLKNEAFSAPVQKVKDPTQEQQTDTPTVNDPEKITAIKNEPKSGVPYTYHFNVNDVVTGGAKSKFKANVEAIQVLQKIEAENRYATPEEQSIMAKYVGWGGIPQAFTTDRAAESLGGNLGEAAPNGWETEQKQLRELLTPEEYKAARASTLTSFYTPPVVTDGVYQALSQFGFEGGNVLEPSMGVGNFFSKMPENMRDNSRLYGVELDSISGRIAQQLYPKERIQIKGFEQTSFNNNSFDVVVGNIPFGDYRVSDKAYDKLGFKIHDYFAAKSVDKVKPGGVVALVTSKFTMDKLNEKARRYLAERCDLLGAVRLPNTAFKQNAGTEVTTDIIFLKKRETMTVEVPDWVHMSETADGIPCNQYFVDNPDMVLGTMAWDERMKGKYGDDSRVTTCVADESIPLSEQLKAAIAKIEAALKLSEPKKNSVMKPTLSLPTRRCEISHIPLLTENCIFVKTRL